MTEQEFNKAMWSKGMRVIWKDILLSMVAETVHTVAGVDFEKGLICIRDYDPTEHWIHFSYLTIVKEKNK